MLDTRRNDFSAHVHYLTQSRKVIGVSYLYRDLKTVLLPSDQNLCGPDHGYRRLTTGLLSPPAPFSAVAESGGITKSPT